jgi:hypothetical protein
MIAKSYNNPSVEIPPPVPDLKSLALYTAAESLTFNLGRWK